MKIDWFNSEKYFFTDESVKRQISENLTDSDLESNSHLFEKLCHLLFTFFSKQKSLYVYKLNIENSIKLDQNLTKLNTLVQFALKNRKSQKFIFWLHKSEFLSNYIGNILIFRLNIMYRNIKSMKNVNTFFYVSNITLIRLPNLQTFQYLKFINSTISHCWIFSIISCIDIFWKVSRSKIL